MRSGLYPRVFHTLRGGSCYFRPVSLLKVLKRDPQSVATYSLICSNKASFSSASYRIYLKNPQPTKEPQAKRCGVGCIRVFFIILEEDHVTLGLYYCLK